MGSFARRKPIGRSGDSSIRQRTAMSVPTSTRSRRIGLAGLLVGLALAAVVYFGLFRDRAETKKIRVDHYLDPVDGGVCPVLSMMVDEGDGMQRFYNSIEGFQFTW